MFAVRKLLLTGAMPAAWDTTGAGGTSATATTSYSDTVPADATCTLIWAAVASSAGTQTLSASVGSKSATLLTTIQAGTSGSFFDLLACFVVFNPPAGSQTISVTSASGINTVINAVHYKNVTGVGTPITAANQTGQPSLSASSTNPLYRYANAFSYVASAATNTFTGYNQTQRYLIAASASNGNRPLLLGDAPGNGGTVNFAATRTTTTFNWGGIIIPLLAA